jgi:hypothetical protein
MVDFCAYRVFHGAREPPELRPAMRLIATMKRTTKTATAKKASLR